jgi:glucokinase
MKKVIALDIGGTKTLGALIDEEGNMLEKKRIPTNPSLGPENLMSSLYSIIENLLHTCKVDALAVASAGRINMTDGSVFYASDNIPGWTGMPIRRRLEDRYHLPVFVENDCKAAGYGEEWRGNAKGHDSYVLIALGTGVGAAVKINGKMLHGAHWSAGELGHMILHPGGRQCNCGLKGCVEQYCSGPALVRRYNELVTDHPAADGYELFSRLKEGDSLAAQVIEEFTADLAAMIVSLSNIYDPEIFILGGGLADTSDAWWSQLLNRIRESGILNQFEPEIIAAALGNEAAVYGMAYYAFQVLERNP